MQQTSSLIKSKIKQLMSEIIHNLLMTQKILLYQIKLRTVPHLLVKTFHQQSKEEINLDKTKACFHLIS